MPRIALCATVGEVWSILFPSPLPLWERVAKLSEAKLRRVGFSPRVETSHPARLASAPSPTRGEGKRKKGGPAAALCSTSSPGLMRAVRHGFRTVEPDIDADEQEQPHHVDEVPVPGGEFEAEMLGRGEVAGIGADQADGQEDGADQDVETVEAGRHEEGRAIDVAGEAERGMGVFIGLHAGEAGAKHDGQDQTVFQALAIILQ